MAAWESILMATMPTVRSTTKENEMNFKNQSIFRFSVITLVTISLALLVGILARSSDAKTKQSSIAHVSLISNGSGWALTTAGLELTANGGTSFSLVRSPIPVLNIDDVVVNGTHVSLAGVINSSPIVKSSSDFGASWKSVNLPVGEANAGGAQFVTQGGIIVGMLVTDVTSSNFSNGEWYATSDGGLRWTHHLLPAGGVITSAGGDLWLAAGPQFASVYRSTNLGLTWSKVAIPAATSANGEALSVPGQLKNGSVLLVATKPNVGNASTFAVTVYLSSNKGETWKVLAQTSFVGQISSGVTAAAAVSDDTIWIGAPTDQSLILISSTGAISSTSSITGVFAGGSINSIIPTGSSSAWVTTMKGECPAGKTSCSEIGVLIRTVDSGKSWSRVDLTPKATS